MTNHGDNQNIVFTSPHCEDYFPKPNVLELDLYTTDRLTYACIHVPGPEEKALMGLFEEHSVDQEIKTLEGLQNLIVAVLKSPVIGKTPNAVLDRYWDILKK